MPRRDRCQSLNPSDSFCYGIASLRQWKRAWERRSSELSSLTGNDLEGTAKLFMSLVGIGAQTQEKNGERAPERAKGILRDNWGSVQAPAEALLEHRELDREQIRAVLN